MRSAAISWCSLLLVCIGVSEKGHSQTQAGVALGNRVRYWNASGENAIRASLVRAANDSFTFKLANDSIISVPRAQISRLEVSTGAYRSASLGAARGVVGGALIGAVGGALSGIKDGACQCVQRPHNMASFAFLGGIVGIAAGAVIGAPHEDWKNVPLFSTDAPLVAAREPRLRLGYVTPAQPNSAIGFLHFADSVSVVLRDGQTGALTTLPRSSIRSSEISLGAERHRVEGFVLGLVAGGALAAGIAARSEGTARGEDSFHGVNTMISGVLGALGGAVIGAIVGSQVSTEKWGEYTLPARRD